MTITKIDLIGNTPERATALRKIESYGSNIDLKDCSVWDLGDGSYKLKLVMKGHIREFTATGVDGLFAQASIASMF